MSTTVIPEKTYVTIQYRADSSAEGKLGFLSPYTKDAAFKKRKDTQDKWAYGYGITVNIDDNDEITVTGQGGGNNRAGNWDSAALFMANCYPRILDNVLIEGFEIAKSVRRYGWNGGGNVLWRIADPRGFELEISSENFARIIDCATIENGTIKGKCIWGRDGSKNILLPEASDVYQDAVKRTTQVNTKISLNDVQVGDFVELLSKDGKDLEGQYLGKYFFLQFVQGENTDETSRYYRYGNGVYHFNKKQVERYLFKQQNGKYFTLSTPKVTKIIDKIETPLNKTDVAQEVSSYLSNTNEIDGIDEVILLSPNKIKLSEVTSKLVPIEYTGEKWPTAHRYYTEIIICELGGKYYVSRNMEDPNDNNYPKAKMPKLQECVVSLDKNSIAPQFTISRGGSGYWNRYETRTDVLLESFDMNTIPKYKIEVTANGIVGKLHYLGYY